MGIEKNVPGKIVPIRPEGDPDQQKPFLTPQQRGVLMSMKEVFIDIRNDQQEQLHYIQQDSGNKQNRETILIDLGSVLGKVGKTAAATKAKIERREALIAQYNDLITSISQGEVEPTVQYIVNETERAFRNAQESRQSNAGSEAAWMGIVNENLSLLSVLHPLKVQTMRERFRKKVTGLSTEK